MRQIVRLGVVPLALAATAATAPAQAPPAGKAAAPAPRTAPPPAARPAAPAPAPAPAATRAPAAGAAAKAATPAAGGQVLATVNGAKITRAEVKEFLGDYAPPPGEEARDYERALNLLVNDRLLLQFLDASKVQVEPKEIDAEIELLKNQLQQQGKDLTTTLAETSTTLDELRQRLVPRLRWRKYVLSQATDEALKAYFEKNAELFNGATVRASHILIIPKAADPAKGPTAAEKEASKQKIAGIKQEIESGKISFADAANKYSEDDSNVQTKAGGDLGFFQRRGTMIEKFAAAAFGQKKGTVSDPVETEFGYHLIQVTDRKEGQTLDFAQAKNDILNQFAAELQERVLTESRQKAQIQIAPLPPDLFAQAPAPVAVPGAAPAAAPAPSAAPARPATPAPVPGAAAARPAAPAPAPAARPAAPAPKAAASPR